MSVPRYVPCLRWKRGEYQAVSRLGDTAKKAMTPLIEIPEMGFDFETRQESKSIDQHLAKIDERVGATWGRSRCLIDLRLIASKGPMASGAHPLTYVFERLRAYGVQAVPVVSPSSDTRFLSAARKIAVEDERGICLRLGIEVAAGPDLGAVVENLLRQVGVGADTCDLVLDLGAPNFEPVDDFAALVETLIKRLPHLRQWGSFALLGTSFPESLAGLPAGLSVLPRSEWRLYCTLLGRPGMRRSRMPDFGDYGVNHPKVIEGDMRLLKPSAAIRYTANDGWLIAKGTNLRVRGAFQQFFGLSEEVVRSRHYSGPNFSAGDKKIKECASHRGGPGSLTTWRFVGTSHHLEKVARDLATLRAS